MYGAFANNSGGYEKVGLEEMTYIIKLVDKDTNSHSLMLH